ncbi:MAG: hypothetical protein IPG38_16855 [Chitinophagaceae bacterium]|nr:hypothetical protein [Chitinophagaceae bacterium]
MQPASSRNELVTYAENPGSIPPNTALMGSTTVIKGKELNISSSKNHQWCVSLKLRE